MLPFVGACARSPQVLTCLAVDRSSLTNVWLQKSGSNGLPSHTSMTYPSLASRRCKIGGGHVRTIKPWSHRGGVAVNMSGEIETKEASPLTTAKTAEAAVEAGLVLFKKGRVRDALGLFDAAMEMKPSPEEAQAALYNKACCHVAQGEWKEAADALQVALSRYELRFSVILNDADMAAFRATPEFRDLREAAKKGGEEVGGSFRRDLKLMSEVQSPFRGVRKFFYVALTAAASISTLFTIPILISSIQGSPDAPPLTEPLQNLAINLGGIVAFVALYIWDGRKEEEQLSVLLRDETLSRLPLRLQTGRVVELVQLRDNTRPVIIVGGKESVAKAVQRADRYRSDLQERGVLLVPLVWSADGNVEPLKKRGFGNVAKTPAIPLPASDDGFDEKVKAAAAKGVTESERKFRAEPVSPGEWEMWVKEQQEATPGAVPGEDIFIVLRLDGRIRKSGKGMPDWQAIVDEVPKLDALVSKLER